MTPANLNMAKCLGAMGAGVLLVCGAFFPLPGKSLEQVEMDSWTGTPTPPSPMSHPLSPVMGVGGLVLFCWGAYRFYKDGEYTDMVIDPNAVRTMLTADVPTQPAQNDVVPEYIPIDAKVAPVQDTVAQSLSASQAPAVNIQVPLNIQDKSVPIHHPQQTPNLSASIPMPTIPTSNNLSYDDDEDKEDDEDEYFDENDDDDNEIHKGFDMMDDLPEIDDIDGEILIEDVSTAIINHLRDISPDLPIEKKKELLWEFLLLNFPLIIRLLKALPLIVWGAQRSGKSSFVKFLCILRQLFLGHIIEVCTPHATKDPKNEALDYWFHFTKVYGYKGDYEAIGQRIVTYYNRIKAPGKDPITCVWDEYSQYVERIQIYESESKNKIYIGNLIKSFGCEAQKMQNYPIIISHGNTSTFTGNSTGTKQTREEGFVSIKLLHQRNPLGDISPAGKGFVKGLEYDRHGKPVTVHFDVPEWLRPEYLIEVFPELNQMEQAKNIPMPTIDRTDLWGTNN
jgi:hypothetical protein